MSNYISEIIFQSTLPLRGATTSSPSHRQAAYFNPRSPCGERRDTGIGVKIHAEISIHAPPAGSDPTPIQAFTSRANFNPRSPCGERPGGGMPFQDRLISIHAPPAGSDDYSSFQASHPSNFNPRSPCGERQNRLGTSNRNTIFQSTLPLRGATSVRAWSAQDRQYFNPRSPCGERPEPPF